MNIKAKMVCVDCETSSNIETYTESTSYTSYEPLPDRGKEGDGYARITLLYTETENIRASLSIYQNLILSLYLLFIMK